MEIKSFVSTNKTGAIVPGAKVYVYKKGTTTLAELYNRSESKISNPMNSDKTGFFEFATENGNYDIQFELEDGSKGVLYGVSFSDVSGISSDITNLDNRVKAQALQIDAVKTVVDEANEAATDAQSTASDALTKANTAQSTAETATTAASKAQSTADSATTAASKAQSTADTAKTAASTAQSKADSASSKADAAQSTASGAATKADTALSTANTAKSTADTATTKAGTAQSTADSAVTKANAAQSTADSATTAASKAQSTADTAKTTADTAKSTADTAKTTADTAKSTADTAKTTADAAKSASDKNTTSISSLDTKIDSVASSQSSGYRRFNSWSDLASTKPSADKERVYLNDYNNATNWSSRVLNGGGWFVGNIVSSSSWKNDDKGLIASNSSDKTYYWKRDIALDDLTIMHFGAVGDGKTDDAPAVYAMFDFLRSSQTMAMNPESNMMPIRFPAGKFFLSPIDLTTRGTKTSDYELNLARQKVIWRENGLQRGAMGGSGTGVGTDGGNAAAYTNVDVAWVKANKPNLYLDYSAQENHNGYNAISYFGITGPKVHYGRGIQTVIVSDGTRDSYVFEVRSIRCEMHGIQFEGGAGTSSEVKNWGTNGPKPGVTAKTNQGFFKNWRSEGQYYDVSCMRMLMVGGRSFDMVDTLDAKFDQCYSELCWGTVLYSGWSNAVVGAWDHGTALEICNSHFVTSLTTEPPIYAPRCAQSMIRNVWIENCVTPAVLHDAAFTMDTFCVEACDNAVYALNCRDIITVYSAPTGVKYDTTTQPYLSQPGINDDISTWQINPAWKAPVAMADRSVYSKYDSLYFRPKGSPIIEWLSAYERGHTYIDNKGIDLPGVLTAGVVQSGTVANPYPEDRWVCVGMVELRGRNGLTLEQIRANYAAAGKTAAEISAAVSAADYGPSFEIEVYNSRSIGTYDEPAALKNRQAGKTVIRRKQPSNMGPGDGHSYWHEGDTIIADVGVSGWGNCKVWLKLPAGSGELSYVIKGGGVSRKNGSGTCTRFEPGRNETCVIDSSTGGFAKNTDGNVISDFGNRLTDTSVLRKQWNVNTGTAGIGLTHSGMITMKSVTPAAANLPTTIELSKVGVWQTVAVDGTTYYLPLFKKNGT